VTVVAVLALVLIVGRIVLWPLLGPAGEEAEE
jgi:hypothetical protein